MFYFLLPSVSPRIVHTVSDPEFTEQNPANVSGQCIMVQTLEMYIKKFYHMPSGSLS